MNEMERLGNVYGEFGTGYAGNVWNINGCSPTLMNMQGGGRQPMIVETKHLTSEKGGTTCLSRAEQSRAEQHSLCSSSNEGWCDTTGARWSSRSDIPNKSDSQRKSPGEWTDKSNTDNGEYP